MNLQSNLQLNSSVNSNIKSLRHPVNFYLTIILASTFYFALSSLASVLLIEKIEKNSLQGKDYLLPFLALGLLFLAVYTIYRYIKNAPIITIDRDEIIFQKLIGEEIFYLKDIDRIDFTGKISFPYLFLFFKEGATISFKSGEVKYIYDDMYSNTWQLKKFLKAALEHEDIKNYLEMDYHDISLETFQEIKGSFLFSFRGILLFILTLLFLVIFFVCVNNAPTFIIPFTLLMLSFIFIMTAKLLYYPLYSNRSILIKNHLLFWKTYVYDFSYIQEIVFETQGKMPNCFRVITQDYKNKLFPAATLRDGHWIAFREVLKSKGMKVRNELYFDE